LCTGTKGRRGEKMKRIVCNAAVFIILLCAFTNATLAGNTGYSIPVSCTIPAIPGINAPLIEQETVASGSQLAAMQEGQIAGSQEQALEKEQITESQDGTLVATKTFYSR
jgi:hypothetical protein